MSVSALGTGEGSLLTLLGLPGLSETGNSGVLSAAATTPDTVSAPLEADPSNLDAQAASTRLVVRLTIPEASSQEDNPASRYATVPEAGQSPYLAATLTALRVDNQLQNEKSDNLFKELDQFGGLCVSGTYYGNTGAGAGGSKAYIKMLLKRAGNKTIMEDAAERLAAEREAEDRQAAAATAPKDAAGNPILVGTDATTDAGATETAPVPSPSEPQTTAADGSEADTSSDTPAAPVPSPSATDTSADNPDQTTSATHLDLQV